MLFIVLLFSFTYTNITFAAKENKHIVTFNAYNGIFRAKTNANKKKIKFKYKHNEKRGYAPSIKRSKYVFNGWYTKKKRGKKYTSKTKICKSVKLYPHWLKAYRIDTHYYELIGKPFLSLEDIETKTGQLTLTKKWNSEDEAIFTAKNGDKYYIGQTIRYKTEPMLSSYDVFYIDKIKCKSNHLVNIKKSTKYSTFMKKLKADWIYYHINIKKHSFSFTCGTTEYWDEPSEYDETLYILWSVKMKSNNKITPNTYFTLSTTDRRHFE